MAEEEAAAAKEEEYPKYIAGPNSVKCGYDFEKKVSLSLSLFLSMYICVCMYV
jgi:hypothetical protein